MVKFNVEDKVLVKGGNGEARVIRKWVIAGEGAKFYLDNSSRSYKESELELYKEDKMEKTFQEVIRDIKEGEVWESDSIVWDIKSIEKVGDFIKIEKRNNSTTLSIRPDCKFLLRRKEVTFQEAFAAYEEGKAIQSKSNGVVFKKISSIDCCLGKESWEEVDSNPFTLEEIRGVWYIRE